VAAADIIEWVDQTWPAAPRASTGPDQGSSSG
jgi:hypothetical protein